MAEKLNIRLANVNDAQSLLDIYAEYINTPITFETELPSDDEFAQRIADITAVYPYLVCEYGGEILGYAYAHLFKERAAYAWGAEASIYLAQKACGMGMGKIMYQTLIDLCREQNVQTIYGCVTSPNPPSEHLHEKLGFRYVGTMRQAGFKDGAWHDVNWYEKYIGTYSINPEPVRKLSEVPAEKIEKILSEANNLLAKRTVR